MTLLSMEDVSIVYGTGGGALHAVRGVSLALERGETVGLVGESGCGKSTLARGIVGLIPLAGGRVLLDGKPVTRRGGRQSKEVTRRVQLVFQDPYSSLNPRMTVGETLTEAMLAHRSFGRSEREAELTRLMDIVALGAVRPDRYPHELSGGQRQRVAIARALAVDPDVLIADEITSALDVSVQASILNLIRDIQRELGVACLFISHDLSVVRHMSTRVAVMHLGRVVEHAPAKQLFGRPSHPYTRVLLDSLPALARSGSGEPLRALREPSDPHEPPAGCDFHLRCPVGPLADPERTICAEIDPHSLVGDIGERCACHFPIASAHGRDPATVERSHRQ